MLNRDIGKQCLPQAYLRGGGSLDSLYEIRKITAKRHRTYPNLVQLKYDQIESEFESPMVRQSRGIILDENNNWEIVARPFDKFFNHSEKLAADLDWKTARVYEKLDGSLIIMYFYAGQWHIATTGSPDASGEVGCYGITFQELFWDVWEDKKYGQPSSLHEKTTFMFELTTPYNRVVVKQGGCDIRLIGIRNNISGLEMPVNSMRLWDNVKEFPPCHSFEALLKQFDTMNPLDQEGYVVVDADFKRVKVKHPGYVALHHLRSSASPKNMLEVVRRGEVEELLAHFPEWTDALEKIAARYESLIMALEQFWDGIKPKTGTLLEVSADKKARKDFAGEAKRCIIPGAMFALLDERVPDAKTYVKEMHIDTLAYMLHVDEVAEELIKL